VRRNEAGGGEAAVCWIRDVEGTCSETERIGIDRDEGDVRNGVWNMDYNDGVGDGEVTKPSKGAKRETEKVTSTVPLYGRVRDHGYAGGYQYESEVWCCACGMESCWRSTCCWARGFRTG
jgi:hypothetical protein